ncbi:MAG: hypothetical protein KC978_10890, partial [Candidatus Omnitrophica bacterium]|nr:hypothetical protein [Candidatus Omnitrophota bacterium]
AYTLLNVPEHHWYYAPILFTLILGIPIALLRGREMIGRMNGLPKWGATTALLAVSALLLYASLPPLFADIPPHKSTYMEAGHWLDEHADSDANIACVEIGVIGYYAGDRDIVDMLGLVTRGGQNEISKGDMTWWYRSYQPDYIVLHDPVWAFEEPVANLESFHRDYRAEVTLQSPQSDRVIIFSRR